MTEQKRWHCQDCRRQWVFATAWNEKNCPTCGSPHIERVTYTPAFPGADIGTASEDIPRPIPELPPTPAIDAKQVQIVDNQTITLSRDEALALSSPEFE